jgi:hypothetical protein
MSISRLRKDTRTPSIATISVSHGLRSEDRDGIIRLMSTEIIEQELATLKQRVEKLEATVEHKPRDAWKEIVGAAKDDDLFEEAMKLGAEWRARANEEGR